MSDVYPDYQDDVDFYSVGFNEPLEILAADQVEIGYAGEVAMPVGELLRDLRVYTLSTKIGVDANGVIVYRAGFGQGTSKKFGETLAGLAASRTAP